MVVRMLTYTSTKMASKPKKLCSRIPEDDSEVTIRHWISSVMSFCSSNYLSQVILTPVKITNCNATARGGSSFSKSFCETEYYEEGLVFGEVFRKGIEAVVEYVDKKSVPKNKEMSLVLDKLLDFVNGGNLFFVQYQD
jgi:hypothetical protein